MPTAAQIHAWPMATDATIARLRQLTGQGTKADARCVAAFDARVQRLGGTRTGPALAFDAAMPRPGMRTRALDRENDPGLANADLGDSPAERLTAWLRQHIDDPDALSEALELLNGVVGPEPDTGTDPTANDAVMAIRRIKSGNWTSADARALARHVTGRRNPRLAADAALRRDAGFASRWPDAGRVRVDNHGQPAPRDRVHTAGFSERWPGADRVRGA